jgi:hypothetical protein
MCLLSPLSHEHEHIKHNVINDLFINIFKILHKLLKLCSADTGEKSMNDERNSKMSDTGKVRTKEKYILHECNQIVDASAPNQLENYMH